MKNNLTLKIGIGLTMFCLFIIVQASTVGNDYSLNGTWCAVKFTMRARGGIYSTSEAKKMIGKQLIISKNVVKGFNTRCKMPNINVREVTVDFLKDSLSLLDDFEDNTLLKSLPYKLTYVEVVTKLNSHNENGFDMLIIRNKNHKDTLIWNSEGTWFHFVKCRETVVY